MYLISIIVFVMLLFSISMIKNPDSFSNGNISFSTKNYFHFLEITLRLVAGIIFIIFSEYTLHPKIIFAVGCLLVLVGIGLSLTGPEKHRKYAIWSAIRFKGLFRILGFPSAGISSFFIYSSLGYHIA